MLRQDSPSTEWTESCDDGNQVISPSESATASISDSELVEAEPENAVMGRAVRADPKPTPTNT